MLPENTKNEFRDYKGDLTTLLSNVSSYQNKLSELIKQKDGYYTKAKIVSTGNSKIRYYGKIQIVNGKKLIDEYAIDPNVVGAKNSMVITAHFYSLHIITRPFNQYQ